MVKSWVRFGYADRNLILKGKRRVQYFLANLVESETKRACQLQYVFCSDEYLHHINLSFLQHDDYTDIISFDLSGNSGVLIEGEIYISVERVIANAKELNVSFEEEILRVMFHGALHLCGYGDKEPLDKLKMRGREDFYLKKYQAL